MKQLLTQAERTLLEACRRNVFDALAGFRGVGTSLQTINENRLYRETHPTFASYVEEEFGITRQRAYQLIEEASVAIEMDQQGFNIVNGGQAAALARVPTEKRVEVMTVATRDGAKVTAAKISEAAKSVTRTETKPPTVKNSGQISSAVERAVANLVEFIESESDCPEAVEENIRFAFETIEERYINAHPEHAPLLAKALRKMLAQIEGVTA